MLHLPEGLAEDLKNTLLRIEGEKNPAPDENWTHDLSVTRRELYCCAKTAALHIASSIEKGQSHDSVISALSLALVEMIFCSLRVAVSVSRITDLEYFWMIIKYVGGLFLDLCGNSSSTESRISLAEIN